MQGDTSTIDGDKGTANFNQSVSRAVRVLDAFARATGDMELGITELSEETGLAKSVISRVVAPLVAGGYLEQNSRSRRYRVGLRTFELGLRYLRRPGAREAALVLLDELVRETGHTAYLGVLDGEQCVVLAAVEGSDRLRVVVSAGERAPAHVTAMGKAIMATLDDDAREELLVKGWPGEARGWRILSPDELRADLELARQRGYAVTQRDGYPGVWSVGVALPTYSERRSSGGRSNHEERSREGLRSAHGEKSRDGLRPARGEKSRDGLRSPHGERLMAVSVDIPAYTATEERLHDLGRLLAKRTRRFSETVLNSRQTIGLGMLA